MNPKILIFDIEIIHRSFGDSWQTMSADPDRSTICSFGYKWLSDKKAKCIGLDKWSSSFKRNPYDEEKLVKAAHKIMSSADGLVTHYGDKFDIKYMRTKFLVYGLDYQILNLPTRDTCLMARRKLKLHSNRLNNLAKLLRVGEKSKMEMHDWFKVIRSNAQAMRKMNKYCAQDVDLLDSVYKKLHHLFPSNQWPHAGIYSGGDRENCPECGSSYVIKHKTVVRRVGRYQGYQCKGCGHCFIDTRMLKEE